MNAEYKQDPETGLILRVVSGLFVLNIIFGWRYIPAQMVSSAVTETVTVCLMSDILKVKQ